LEIQSKHQHFWFDSGLPVFVTIIQTEPTPTHMTTPTALRGNVNIPFSTTGFNFTKSRGGSHHRAKAFSYASIPPRTNSKAAIIHHRPPLPRWPALIKARNATQAH